MFQPWKGVAWEKPDNMIGGLRLLVLGESHYHDDASLTGKFEENATTDTIITYAINGSTRFFNGIAHVLSGKPRSERSLQDAERLWSSVAFYNYVPIYVGTGPRERPLTSFWRQAPGPFQTVIRQLEPEVILVCGFVNWNWMLDGIGEKKGWEFEQYIIGSALALKMKHPSSRGFSPAYWHKVLSKYLRR